MTTSIDQAALQRTTIRALTASQVLGGVGMASGIAVGALLAEQLSGSETLAGLGTTTQVLGGALIAIPVARLMAAKGRRPGLALGYVLALLGAATVVTSAVVGSFPLMLVGMFLFGGGTTANGQARYAAADLALPEHRGRDLSIVVWSTTIGSVLGPNLVGPGKTFAEAVGIPELAGSFLFSLAGFVLALVVVARLLRPDPLLTARALERAARAEVGERHTDDSGSSHDGSMRRALTTLRTNALAREAVLVIALGHVVMVSVMVMTPLHMSHGHADLEIIGFVISVHILGMYAFSPLVGMAVDRWGSRHTAMAGGAILAVAAFLASRSEVGWSGLLLVALFLLGVGWSCTLVSGSTLLTNSLTTGERPAVQGLSDVLMGLGGAGGGALAGVVVGGLGYAWLAGGAAVVGVVIMTIALSATVRHASRVRADAG
ncbi:MFS transporter permease [Intrasporangium chromatireducens Q5-1]|uniref:MFS transporter permease n=1 Tax=Intrasporangium chromatireducens Q5-1 TaxID=584657 RepID=W9GNM7_9MICO|nr:MFS transporter [Intrasporangium chromatireducens]EWT06428.1 MFS transporter permease [Intrasporangium chromatireducens Q5-1]